MKYDLFMAVFTVVFGLGGLGTWYLITKDTDTFTKSVFGWLFAASWSLGVIMPATHASVTMSEFSVMSMFIFIAVAPAFLFGFIMDRREKRKLQWC